MWSFIFVCMLRFNKVLFVAIFVLTITLGGSCRSKGPYNPYLKMKDKPSEIQMKGDKKVIKKGNRRYKRQMGNNRKKLFGRRKAPGT